MSHIKVQRADSIEILGLVYRPLLKRQEDISPRLEKEKRVTTKGEGGRAAE